jgi:hypothetical protein
MKTYGGMDVYIHVLLISALIGGEWSTSRPRPLYPRGKSPRYPLDRRLGVPQSQSRRFEEEKILDPTGVTFKNTLRIHSATLNHVLFQSNQFPASGVSAYSWDIRPKDLRLPGGPSEALGPAAPSSSVPASADVELNGTAIKERLMANRLPESCV